MNKEKGKHKTEEVEEIDQDLITNSELAAEKAAKKVKEHHEHGASHFRRNDSKPKRKQAE